MHEPFEIQPLRLSLNVDSWVATNKDKHGCSTVDEYSLFTNNLSNQSPENAFKKAQTASLVTEFSESAKKQQKTYLKFTQKVHTRIY